jgi:hypothetical protein
MTGFRNTVAVGLIGLATLAPRPAAAQVGMPPPPGADPNAAYNGYAAPPPTHYAHPVALGFGISLLVVGVGMLAGGFGMLASKGSNQAVAGALLSVGGVMFASSIPLIIMGSQQVYGYPPGYGPVMTSTQRWIGSPRVLLPNAHEGKPGGVAWGWVF